MKLHQLILLTIAGTCLSANTLAQDSDPVRFYDVEIILYKNTKVPKSQEYTLPISSPIKDDDLLDLSKPSSIEAFRRQQYELIAESGLRLTDVAQKIAASSRYDILKHFAWRQPGLEKSKTTPLWIKAGRRYGTEFISIDDKIEQSKLSQAADDINNLNLVAETQLNTASTAGTAELSEARIATRATGLYEVEGKVMVALSRYLHVYTDLVLRKPRRSMDTQLETADSDPLLYENLADARILDNHRLKEHRRMRSKTLHYLDSPELSMLILITPYEKPEQTTTTLPSTDESDTLVSN